MRFLINGLLSINQKLFWIDGVSLDGWFKHMRLYS